MIPWRLVVQHAPFGDPNNPIRALKGEIDPVVFVLIDVAIRIVDGKLRRKSFERLEEKIGAPGGVGIGSDRDIEENGDRVAVKTIVYELPIERRGEKVVAGIEPAGLEGEIAAAKRLDEVELVQFHRLGAEDLLDGELVADLAHREARPCAPNGGGKELEAGPSRFR